LPVSFSVQIMYRIVSYRNHVLVDVPQNGWVNRNPV